MFTKQKRDERLKVRTCTDGKKKQDKHAKEEIASSKVALESVFLSGVIDPKEERDAETLYLPNAFMQNNIGDEQVLMKLRGALA